MFPATSALNKPQIRAGLKKNFFNQLFIFVPFFYGPLEQSLYIFL